MTGREKVTNLIASFFEEELVRLISNMDLRIQVIYKFDLLRPPRRAVYTGHS